MNAATSCGPLSDINIDHNQGMQNKWDFLQPLVDQESFSQKCLSNCVLSRRIRGGPSWTAWLTQNNWLLNLMLQTDEYQQNLPPGNCVQFFSNDPSVFVTHPILCQILSRRSNFASSVLRKHIFQLLGKWNAPPRHLVSHHYHLSLC